MNKKIILPVFLSLALVLSGCWDRRELESMGLVQALGIDSVPGGKGLTITTMIAVPAKLKGGSGGESGGGGGGGDTGVFIISKQAPTIYEGFNLINTTVNREITLLQNSVLFIGEDLSKKGIKKWIDSLVRYREMRRTLNIFICRGTAVDIMQVKPQLEKNPAEYFTDFSRLTRFSGMYPMTTLNDFMDRFEAKAQDNYAPLLGKFHRQDPNEYQQPPGGQDDKSGGGSGSSGKPPKAKDIRLLGTAIFKQDKVVGSFDIYETQILQILTGSFHEALLSISDPLKKGLLISYRLMNTGAPQIKYKHQNGEDRFHVKVRMEAELLSIQSGIDYTEPQKEAVLAKHIACELEERMRKAIKKAQQLNSDVFGFGIKVRNTMLTGADWDRYNWPDKFKNAIISVQAHVSVRRVGVQFGPPHMR
ncbi:MAG TPA: hypothetical protein DDW50_15870 [Firmicutes bacterium]|jgi:spore germination protein KC|nr:hypothetical protein [Bacillota bacterium]